MRRGQKTSAEQVLLKLRQIEVQTAQGKSLALACKEADVSEQSYVTSAYSRRSSTR
ncbi:transposase [Methylobacterium sp. Leaf92]|nr:transposase [Methylobacterium sp. Leaf92]